MLDETIDHTAVMIASYTLDQIEQHLRNNGKSDLADALRKLQIDNGYHYGALSEGFDTPEGYIEQKVSPRTGKDQQPMEEDTIAQIKSFEPLTHERLKMLVAIERLLPDSDLRNELRALNDKLGQSTPQVTLPPATKIAKPAP